MKHPCDITKFAFCREKLVSKSVTIVTIMNHAQFVKDQKSAIRKALSKEAIPLKQKHARQIVMGTHQEQTCSLFWGISSQLRLETHPLLTWKFCHLLHCLIRDGHESVPLESYRHLGRLSKLGDFWLHLHAYGEYLGFAAANEQYCSVLGERLEFHRKYPQIPGNLVIPREVLAELKDDVDRTFDASIEILDHLKSMLLLKRRVFEALSLTEGALSPQGQTLLAPVILILSDTDTLYSIILDLIVHLYSVCHPNALVQLRYRFENIHDQIGLFYEQARRQAYITHHVTVPTLEMLPDFERLEMIYFAARARELAFLNDVAELDNEMPMAILPESGQENQPSALLLPD
ncbi:hypothetical protein PMAYCL1PPCAC_10437 [Pristionchus mayeri]|uniref:ENTH domain-containing protein n=1 Tax=Pristionchus mayeri TaxID=1317129 RepID=A0AAN4ZL55_9BILA|nr:hypothetical protein PMAYCL1PPCAC_10437 [Pristionchus mayeri]